MSFRHSGRACITFGLAVLFLITIMSVQYLKGPLPVSEKCEDEHCSLPLHQGSYTIIKTDSFSFWDGTSVMGIGDSPQFSNSI